MIRADVIQAMTARCLLEPGIVERLARSNDIPAFSNLEPTDEELSLLRSSGIGNLLAGRHAVMHKRMAVLRRFFPGTFRLISLTDLGGSLTDDFHSATPSAVGNDDESRLIRDGNSFSRYIQGLGAKVPRAVRLMAAYEWSHLELSQTSHPSVRPQSQKLEGRVRLSSGARLQEMDSHLVSGLNEIRDRGLPIRQDLIRETDTEWLLLVAGRPIPELFQVEPMAAELLQAAQPGIPNLSVAISAIEGRHGVDGDLREFTEAMFRRGILVAA